LFELDGEPRKLIGDYSKGMRKRVAMAAALIHRPELFLLDEPFEGVDAVGARLMKEILLEQVRHGATMFLTSHVSKCGASVRPRRHHSTMERWWSAAPWLNCAPGSETLEDVFVRVVGAERPVESLGWL